MTAEMSPATTDVDSSVVAVGVSQVSAWRKNARSAIRLAILIFFALFWAAPVAWMILTSLKPEVQTVSDPPTWFPQRLSDFTLENYRNVLFEPRGIDLIEAFRNSLIVAVVGTLLTVAVDVPAAYAFARMRFPFRNVLFALIVASLIVPAEILLVPNYVTIWKLGWLNEYQALIVPPIAGAFGVFLLRQFMLGIPQDLIDAAKLDGANHVRILMDIVIPATRGAVAALGIFTFLFYWNEFTWPYITINRADMMTLPVALVQFRADFLNTYGQQMAGATISAIPAVLLFLVAQRMIIRSITLTGVKG